MRNEYVGSDHSHHHDKDGGFWENFWEVFTDPPHIVSEIAYNTIYAIAAYVFLRVFSHTPLRALWKSMFGIKIPKRSAP